MVCPYLAPRRRSILPCLGTRIKYRLEIPSLTESWSYLPCLQLIVQCTLSPPQTDHCGGLWWQQKSAGSSVGLCRVGRELWQRLLLGTLLPIFRKRQKATSLTMWVKACPKSVKTQSTRAGVSISRRQQSEYTLHCFRNLFSICSGTGGKIVLLDLDELEAKYYIKICVPQEACEHRSFVEIYYIYICADWV